MSKSNDATSGCGAFLAFPATPAHGERSPINRDESVKAKDSTYVVTNLPRTVRAHRCSREEEDVSSLPIVSGAATVGPLFGRNADRTVAGVTLAAVVAGADVDAGAAPTAGAGDEGEEDGP
jgi:hypothetical protein